MGVGQTGPASGRTPPAEPTLPDSRAPPPPGPLARMSDSPPLLSVGDKVRHRQRPEWGVGSVTKTELITRQGSRDQRLWIRFANAGLKTMLRSIADLESLGAGAATQAAPGRAPMPAAGASLPAAGASMPAAGASMDETLVAREAAQDGGWLGAIAKRRPEDAMVGLPASASDPFLPFAKRLEIVLGLYRFEPTGGKLIDWAVAQSGLDDPLARFNRHELEAFFQRWTFERDLALVRLAQEARLSSESTDVLERRIAALPPALQTQLRAAMQGASRRPLRRSPAER